ncbi:MAG TPA: DNA-binding protein WhiA [Bacillota bacterium]|jgi:DNA-binding protein WhiA|nr:DNA-binding protein WhiA [Bacillota bacterium]HPZ41145.1 DNA-binding protein WhiA [Bacillota bacterium]HQD52644.1 DNA-binding protein WhiA [Bacillota bacterium]
MSFSREVKLELVRHEQKAPCCNRAELTALLLLRGYLTIRSHEHILSIEVEHVSLARHLFSLLKAAGAGSPEVLRKQVRRLGIQRYQVQVTGQENIAVLLQSLGLKRSDLPRCLVREPSLVPSQRCCRRAFIRGAFLAGGSLNTPTGAGYHLEINCGSREDADLVQSCLEEFSISAALRHRRGNYYLYLKKAEAIADFLRIIEADSAVLQLESARVIKSMRSQVNRLVNCDTANLEKVVTSAQQQLMLIDRLEQRVGLENLSPPLREIAILRRRHPEVSMKELGRMCEPPLSKSAVNHRFRKLAAIEREGSRE